MAADTFIDTSGFYALLVRRDRLHDQAAAFVAQAVHDLDRFVTTDYVLDESATLLSARGYGRLVRPLFGSISSSNAIRIEWTTPERFYQTQDFFLRHSDKAWSFTDCLSFVLMQEYGLQSALTSDQHFEQAGFRALLKR